MSEISTKPYLLRALYEWCTDSGFTPYIVVIVDSSTKVPMEFVKNGEIVLNISFSATAQLKMDNNFVHFRARFGGVSREIEVPMENVTAIYARENGQGMTFDTNLAERLASKKKNLGEDADASNQKAETVFTLAAVPKGDAQPSGEKANDDDQPDPPKPSGKPTLTRIK
jgi:stringent starvation protein B